MTVHCRRLFAGVIQRSFAIIAAAAGIVGFATVACGCKVPVFRYAVERWLPAAYEVIVLTTDATAVAAFSLPDAAVGRGAGSWVPDVRVASPEQPFAHPLAAAWSAHGGPREPVLVLRYPPASGLGGRIAHAGALREFSGAEIVSSPVREAVARRLASGVSVVWILLESGRASADAAARRVLEEQFGRDRQTLHLPDAAALEVDAGLLEEVRIPLQIEFELIAVAKNDPREEVLLNCLLNSEDDLRDYDTPIAFPVFGRGVALYALVGPGITAANVAAAHAFMTGDCSCTVKEQNPGFDLPLAFDWDEAVGDVLISQPPPDRQTAPKLLAIPPGATGPEKRTEGDRS